MSKDMKVQDKCPEDCEYQTVCKDDVQKADYCPLNTIGNKPDDKLKAKTEHQMKSVPLYKYCPYCGRGLIQAYQPSKNYDDSNHVRMCSDCNIAWIWRYD